ncbi:MAG: 5-(carboxyamino)imidazole ribonucleotide synthase, partial [Mycobacterium sp.]
RKIGHINFLGWDPLDVAVLRERGERAAHWLSHGEWTDGWDPHAAGDDAAKGVR